MTQPGNVYLLVHFAVVILFLRTSDKFVEIQKCKKKKKTIINVCGICG